MHNPAYNTTRSVMWFLLSALIHLLLSLPLTVHANNANLFEVPLGSLIFLILPCDFAHTVVHSTCHSFLFSLQLIYSHSSHLSSHDALSHLIYHKISTLLSIFLLITMFSPLENELLEIKD